MMPFWKGKYLLGVLEWLFYESMWFLFGGGHLFVVSLYGGGKYFKEKALILSIRLSARDFTAVQRRFSLTRDFHEYFKL